MYYLPWAGTLLIITTVTVGDPSQRTARRDIPEQLFATATTVVSVDVVVRDKDGHLVAGLRPEQFRMREDGVLQAITSFEPPRVTKADQPVVALGHLSTSAIAASPSPSLVAIVFEELGPEARAMAYQASLKHLEHLKSAGAFVGVFVIDRGLHVVLPYSSDDAQIRIALRTAAMHPGCPVWFAGDVAPAEDAPGCAGSELPRQQRALATLSSLRALVATQELIPGRKSILLFSEGVPLDSSSNVMDAFNRLVSWANDVRTSFYAVDAAGLRARSASAQPRNRMRTPVLGPQNDGSVYKSVGPDEVMFDEPYVALSRLAGETGGAFVDGTNDLGEAARRVNEDQRAHYLVGYSPSNATADDTYRRISVTVSEPDTTVQARGGYLATRHRKSLLKPDEIAPFLMLNQKTAVTDFPIDVSVQMLKGTIASLRLRVLTADLAGHKKGATGVACAAVVMFFRVSEQRTGRIVQMGSDRSDMSWTEEGCGSGTIEFVRELTNGTASQFLEVLAYDLVGQRTSVRRMKLDGPPRG